MKVKLSKKILSVILAALMVVTSIPVIGFVAFADESNAIDPAVVEVETAMNAFETKLSSQGMYTNVVDAYNAYVNCQKALDAYIYGGEADALDGVAAALNDATAAISTFTPKTANAVPSFEGDTVAVSDYAGVVYNNILYTTQTTNSNGMASASTANTIHKVYYPSETTLLYDGSTDVIMPVMGSGVVDGKKDRYIYTSYPSVSTSDTTNSPDFKLQGYWHDGNGTTLDFGWTWGQSSNGPGYSSTVLGDANHRSSKLDYTTNFWGTFTGATTKYFGNALIYTGTPASTYSEYGLSWRFTSGDSPNSDSGFVDASGNKIIVVNYKTLLDALSAAGSKMKSVDLAQFSEGGLSEYVSAMEAATDFDPTVYFTSSNDYVGCSNAIAAAADAVTNAPVTNKNSADYQALRDAMSQTVRTMYSLGNTGYTEASWKAFAQAYEAAQSIMASANNEGYVSGSIAAAQAKTLSEKVAALEVEGSPVDASALTTAIDTFQTYGKSYFTEESYSAALDIVNAAKVAVWGSEDNYGISTSLPEDSPESQALVAEHTQAVLDATKALRISNTAVVAVENTHRYSLVEAYALRDTIGNPSDYVNLYELDAAISSAKDYEATLADKELTDFEAQIAEYTSYVNAIVVAYENLQYSFTALPDGTVSKISYGNTNGYSADDNRTYLSNAVTDVVYIKTVSGESSYTTEYDLTHDNVWYQFPNYHGVQMHALGFGAFGTDTMNTSNGSMKVTWKEGGALIASPTGAYSDYHSYLMKMPESAVNGSDYIDIPQKSYGNKIFGETTVTVGDIGIKAVSFTTPDIYTYFICNGEIRNFVNTDVKQTVTVVDISDLFELVQKANQMMAQYDYNNYKCFTDSSWNNLTTALASAQADMDYHNMTATQIVEDATWRYNNLNTKMNALVRQQSSDVHKFTELDGSTHATCTKGGTLNLQCSLCGYKTTVKEEALGHDWVYTSNNDSSTHTVSCSRGDVAEKSEKCENNGENVCSKCGQVLLASWTEYTAAISSLKEALNSDIYPVSTLNEINSVLESLTYYDAFINSNTDDVYADVQEEINQEAQAINDLIPSDGAIDVSALDAAKEVVQDPDQYDADAIATLEAEFYEEVSIAGVQITGTTFENQDEVNNAVSDALNAVMTYSISLNSQVVKTDVPYGTEITIDGEGNIITDGVTPAEGIYTWSGHYAAPSLGSDSEGSYNESTDMYLTNSNTYTFVLKGETYLTAINSADEALCKVTVKNNVTGYTSDVFYVEKGSNIGRTLDGKAKNIACYTFDDFYDAPTGGNIVNSDTIVNDDMTVYARYTVNRTLTFDVSAYPDFDSFYSWSNAIIKDTYNYNDRIDLTTDREDFFCWVTVTNPTDEMPPYHMQIVSFERDYSFYVCETVYLFPISKAEAMSPLYGNTLSYPNGTPYDAESLTVSVDATSELIPIYSSDDTFEKFSMIGSYAVPEGFKVIEKGFLINIDAGSDVAAEDFVVTNETLKRVKVLHLTCGNQFVLNVKGIAQDSPIDYCAYAVVEDSEGNRYEVYSNAVMNATAD